MLPALPATNCSVVQTVLVLEADAIALGKRAALLQETPYTVTTARNLQEVQRQREISIAILSISFGAKSLRDTAEFIRGRWPLARILVVGDVQLALEDNLYDEAVHDLSRKEELLNALARLSEAPSSSQNLRYGVR